MQPNTHIFPLEWEGHKQFIFKLTKNDTPPVYLIAINKDGRFMS